MLLIDMHRWRTFRSIDVADFAPWAGTGSIAAHGLVIDGVAKGTIISPPLVRLHKALLLQGQESVAHLTLRKERKVLALPAGITVPNPDVTIVEMRPEAILRCPFEQYVQPEHDDGFVQAVLAGEFPKKEMLR